MRFYCTLFIIFISGCAINNRLVQNESVRLIEPSSSNSIVYFLRIPKDYRQLIIYLNDQRIAKMDNETYTAVSLPPGNYKLVAIDKNKNQSKTFKMVLLPSQRRFFYTSIPSNNTITDTYIWHKSSLYIMSLTKGYIENREWKELSESDAKGLISILKPTGAESNVP